MQGARLGPYRIDRELGSGGMGKVYAATGPDGVVALKVVHPHLLETPGFFKRFLREAQLGQSIRHENVVRTLDCDQEFADGTPQCFLVMEYVEGQTLAELQRELERVPEELCRHVACEICKGLAAVHAAGVVHRDLKPENVLITADHVVKVMDLGVAQVADEALRLSKSGAFVGSVEYAAPEQFKGGDVDGRTDLHALGVLLYELSSAQHPYRGGGFHEVLTRVCDAEPRRLGQVNPQLSAFFEEVVHTLLVKDPRGRFASAAQLLSVLELGEDSDWWRQRARKLQADTRRPIRRIRIPRETAVYGREIELERLLALFATAKAGDGQVVLIDGEAGIGKSRLVDELVARLESEGEDLNFLFGSYPSGGAATAAGGFSSAYREHFGEPGSAAFLTQAPELALAFDAVLRGAPPPGDGVELTKSSLGTCFVHATRSLAAERPTVVLIDDLHFAPEDARALFTALALAVPGHRVLLVGTMRPGVSDSWVADVTRLDNTTRISVPRLGPKDLAGLLADSFRSKDLAVRLAGQIGIKSDGNPFFAFEIIRGLREGQFITQTADGTWASTRVIDEIQIPSSVLDLVNARVAGLSEDERALLDVAACWGFEFDPGLVGDVLGQARIPTLRAFGQIERQHRLVQASGRTMVFDHHQVQEALYGSLLEQLREEYHAALAEALETRTAAADKDPESLDGVLCVDLCAHFLAGARGESALRYLVAAETHLREGHQTARAIELNERALAVPGLLAGVGRARALLRLAGDLELAGRPQRHEECVREIERLADASGDDGLRGEAARALGRFFERTGRSDDAEAAYGRALELARKSGDRRAEAAATGSLGNVYFLRQRFAEAEEHHARALEMFREVGERRGEALAIGNLGNALWGQQRLAEARERLKRQRDLCREIGFRRGVLIATANLGNVVMSQGDRATARDHYEQALQLSREIGDRYAEAIAVGNLAGVRRAEGRLDDARELLQRGVALCREVGDRASEARSLGNLAAALSALGRLAESAACDEQAIPLYRALRDRTSEAHALLRAGNVLRRLGRLSESRELFERAMEVSRATGDRRTEASVQQHLALVLREQGEDEPCREQLLACIELCDETGQREIAASAQLCLGSLRAAAGGGSDGRAELVAARDAAREGGWAGVELLALAELALLPDGDAEDALAVYGEHHEHVSADDLRAARLLLWRATGDREHLDGAKRLLDEALALVPAACHEAMTGNVRIHREILAAWRAECGDDDETRGTESATRIVPRE